MNPSASKRKVRKFKLIHISQNASNISQLHTVNGNGNSHIFFVFQLKEVLKGTLEAGPMLC